MEDPWGLELEALQCILEADHLRILSGDPAVVDVQVLYGAEGGGDEYWVRFSRPAGYPTAAVQCSGLKPATKSRTAVPVEDLRTAVAEAAAEAAAVGAEALFNVVTVAKEFVERCIEQDTAAAVRAAERIDAELEGPIMKAIAHDADLVQVYRTLDLTQTTVLLTPGRRGPLWSALERNIAASIQLYRMLHGDGVWSHLTLDAFWEVGFDSRDRSYAARRFNERKQALARAKKRRLLWHGSALAAIACILTNGSLRKVQRAAHGRMFGDGVYFADCMCKSLTYCSGGAENEFYLLLCSVDCGQCHETDAYFEDVDPEILESRVPLAVHGNLHMTEVMKLETGDLLAVGGCCHRFKCCAVNFNEYIVFKEDGHVNRYLVRLRVKPEGLDKRRIFGR
eukprot:EG_transcript_12012